MNDKGDTGDTADIRREYDAGKLSEDDLLKDPFQQFERWFKDVKAAMIDPTAMVLATVDAQGRPNQRTVLLKGFDADGFVFFTNYLSSKAKDIENNEQVSLHFLWSQLDRQICIRGTAEKVEDSLNEDYFSTRPRESQIAAWASEQSTVLDSRQTLDEKYAQYDRDFQDKEIEKPDFWGGYRVKPQQFEFWQGGVRRLHDRFLYTPITADGTANSVQADSSNWLIQRLSP